MKTSSILYIALLLSSVGAFAQGPGGPRPLFDFRKKNVDEATKAKALDAAKKAAQQVPDNVKDKAKELMLSPEGVEMRQKAMQAAQTMIQGNATGATTPAADAAPATPAVTTPKVAVVEAPPAPVGPQPKPLQPLNLDEAPKATKGQIDITAQKSAYFDANSNYGMYTGDVKARHPQMYIECEELELYMTKQEGGAMGAPKPKKVVGPAAKDLDILAPAKKPDNAPPPIDKADARGPMVTIEKVAEDGELQIGHCKHLIYDGKTENTTLLEWPQVQAGNQLHKATEAGCIMIIDKSGKLHTTGGHETIILQGEEIAPRRSGPMRLHPHRSDHGYEKEKTKDAGGEGSLLPMNDVATSQAGSAPAPGGAHDINPDENTLLHTEGLKKVYDGRAVVNGVDIEVKKGEIVGLLGPNGAGKTTTFYMIVGLVQPNGGKVTFDGKDTTHQPMYMRSRLGMGYLPQEESIFRRLTVRENIMGVMETQPYTRAEREEQTQSLMEKFGIDHVADNLAITLSGGEKRRLTIARSLVTSPKLLMLDEPFSGVDPIAVSEIQEIIRMLRSAGLAILITDHNVRETLNIVDRAYLIFEGRVRRHGSKDFLVNDDEARRLYLGEGFTM